MIVPAFAATCVLLWLSTVGTSFIGFGIATSCTDLPDSVHGCDAMYRWLQAGRIGQWVLLGVVIAALAAGLARPASRKAVAVSTWALLALGLAWFAFCIYSANSSF